MSLRRTFVLTGDGELQEGSNWEAMMAASQYQLDRLTVIVDRNRLQQGATIKETNDLDPLPDKAVAFGFGVVEVNGHDHGELLDVLSAVPFRPGKPTFVIAHTHKGHPISFMSNNVAWHHKVPSADQLRLALDELESRRRPDDSSRRSDDRHPLASRRRSATSLATTVVTRMSRPLSELADADHRIVGVVNDSIGSSKLDAFKKAFPDRLINVGIAEQDMVGVAAGLANGGRIPFVSAASCFLTARALEQIKADVAYSNHNVKLCGMSPGMAYGELGPTHHSIEDIAWLRAIDNLTIVVPADPTETAAALRWAAEVEGPVFVRVSRMAVPEVNAEGYTFVPGKAVTLRDGSDVTLISNGTVLWRALVAAELLEADGISTRVLSMPTVKPLDTDAVVAAARETGGIVTAEEATTAGGLGGAVAETVVQNHPTRMKILGVPEFAPTGSAGYLLDRYGMSPEGIAEAARALIG